MSSVQPAAPLSPGVLAFAKAIATASEQLNVGATAIAHPPERPIPGHAALIEYGTKASSALSDAIAGASSDVPADVLYQAGAAKGGVDAGIALLQTHTDDLSLDGPVATGFTPNPVGVVWNDAQVRIAGIDRTLDYHPYA